MQQHTSHNPGSGFFFSSLKGTKGRTAISVFVPVFSTSASGGDHNPSAQGIWSQTSQTNRWLSRRRRHCFGHMFSPRRLLPFALFSAPSVFVPLHHAGFPASWPQLQMFTPWCGVRATPSGRECSRLRTETPNSTSEPSSTEDTPTTTSLSRFDAFCLTPGQTIVHYTKSS